MAPSRPAKPASRIVLSFKDQDEIENVDDPIHRDISALALVGRSLWAACDETASLERVTTGDWETFASHKNFNLGKYFDLPDGKDGEMDIEGIGADGGYLWVTGSHSLKRDTPEQGKGWKDAHDEFADIDRDPNRFFLGRVPLKAETNDGVFKLAKKVKADGGKLSAACLAFKKNHGNKLIKELKGDRHLGPWLDRPCKENGFDIEGLAVRGNRVFLGLRGPVLSGWAVILELDLKEPNKGRLKPRKIGPDGERYRKHFVDLHGLGIRDLLAEGDDLLILAGPTMDLEGRAFVARWPNAFDADEPKVVFADGWEHLLELPYGHGSDHPEGIVRWTRNGIANGLLVAYDSPHDDRVEDADNEIEADVFDLDREPAGEKKEKAA